MNHITYKQFFATLATDSRLDILEYLQRSGPQNVQAIAEGTGQEQSAVSHSLRKLLTCQYVHVEAQGKSRCYSLNSDTIVPLLELADRHIEKYCDKQCTQCSSK